MPVMTPQDDTQKPKKTKPGKQGRKGVPLHIYIPPALSDALAQAAEAGRRKLTQEVIIALEEHLRKLKRWPASDDEEKPD